MRIYCQQQRCSPRSVVSGDISLMQIFVGVHWWCGVKCECGRQKCEFSLSMPISFVWSSPLSLHIEIYTASHGFPATARLLFDVTLYFHNMHTYICIHSKCTASRYVTDVPWPCGCVVSRRRQTCITSAACSWTGPDVETSRLFSPHHTDLTRPVSIIHISWSNSIFVLVSTSIRIQMGFDNDGHKPWRLQTMTVTTTVYDEQLGEIYPTMLNELNCAFGISFSRFHCCGCHGHGLWPSRYRPMQIHLCNVFFIA